ncbi:MAG: hypothetical protein WBB25_20580 [Sulfitobacter sp.]
MYRKFIGTIAAAAIAITALGAAPARADQDDVSRALAALLGVAVIGAIIHDNKRDDRADQRQHRQPVYSPPRHQQPRVYNPPRQRHVEPRPLPRKVDNRLLPGQCLSTFQTRRGTYRGFGKNCLANNYRFSNNLPNRCLISVKTRRGHGNAYEARCMRDAGYRLARG